MKAYPEYKDSGVEWLGEVPAGWDVSRFKNHVRERDERSENGDETLLSVSAYTGVRPRSEGLDDGEFLSRAESLQGYKVAYSGDLVMNIMLAWNRAQGITEFDGIVSPAYAVFKLGNTVFPAYLNHLVRSDEYCRYFKAFSAGVIDSRLRLYPEKFGGLFAILPPFSEQRKIAAFLDLEVAKIDDLIEEQRCLIALLAEKRQATISHAVTKGLNPNAKLKPSGIDWLGDVPEEWDVVKMRHLCNIETGDGDTVNANEDGEYPFFVRSETIERIGRYTHDCEAVMTSGDGAGVGKIFHHFAGKFSAHQRVYIFTRFKRISGAFFYHYLKSNFYKVALAGAAKSTVDSLRRPMLADFPIPIPPNDEQNDICLLCDNISKQFADLTDQAVAAITLLQERRSALISAAVTGKIDLRDFDDSILE